MIKTRQTTKYVSEVACFQCDRCKKDTNDDMQMQEFHHIRFTGGYASVFGDGSKVECDLCQDCLMVLIKDYMRFPDA